MTRIGRPDLAYIPSLTARRRGDRIAGLLLQCMSPLLALSGQVTAALAMSAFGGKADIGRSRCLVWSAAIDAVDGAHSAASRCHRVVDLWLVGAFGRAACRCRTQFR